MTRAPLFLACAVASSVWCVSAASRLGVTFDEPTYIAAGLDRWRGGGIGGLMRLGAMPLPADVVSLPVRIVERAHGIRFRVATDGRGHVTEDDDLRIVLPWARAVTLVFWWMLLASGWTIARQAGGPWAGAAAAAWLASEPSLLAHSTLATTDVAVTACLLAFGASLAKGGRWLPAVWLALAILSKASALAFAPLVALAVATTGSGSGTSRERLRDGVWIGAIALAIVFAYCGSDWRRDESFVAWARSLGDGSAAAGVRWVAEQSKVFSNAGEGLVQQIKHNVRGHPTFVLGRAYDRAVWFYFPVVFLIKASGGVLVGAAAIAAASIARRRALLNWPLAAAALIIVFSPLFRVQLGIRMILPALALAIVGVTVAAARLAADGPPRRTRLIQLGTVALIGWSAVASWRAWPDAIRFANELAGGSDEACRLVSDSNYDWGQGLPDLARALEAGAPMDLWYWGTDPMSRSGPWRLLDVRALAPATDADLIARLDGRVLAASATLLYGSVLTEGVRVAPEDEAARATAEALRRVLRARRWRWRTGTFFVYDFRQ